MLPVVSPSGLLRSAVTVIRVTSRTHSGYAILSMRRNARVAAWLTVDAGTCGTVIPIDVTSIPLPAHAFCSIGRFVVVSNVTVRKAMPCLYLLQTLAVTPLDPEWSVDTPVTFNGKKILSLFVLGVALALMTAPAFAQDDITQ